MTITQVKEINEKIIELIDCMRQYTFEICCVTFKYRCLSDENYSHLGFVIDELEKGRRDLLTGFCWETKSKSNSIHVYYPESTEETYKWYYKWISMAIENREKVAIDISLDELSLWIDLFALIYC